MLGTGLLSCIAIGCGGDSDSRPSAPTALATPDNALPAGTILGLVAGDTGDPVAAARVVVGGRTYTADGGGQVTLAERVPYGALMDIVSPAFLDRQTLIRRDDSRQIVLWPRASTRADTDESYTLELVYTDGSAHPGAPGSSPMERLRRGTAEAFVVVSPEILQNDQAHWSHLSAIAWLNSALGGRFTYHLSPTRPSSGIVFEARVNPADPLCADRTLAYTLNSYRSGEIVSGSIVYCRLEDLNPTLAAHELGHTVGLNHSPRQGDLMYRFMGRSLPGRFSRGEVLSMGLLFERPGGNRFPDNDRDVSAASASGTRTTVCH